MYFVVLVQQRWQQHTWLWFSLLEYTVDMKTGRVKPVFQLLFTVSMVFWPKLLSQDVLNQRSSMQSWIHLHFAAGGFEAVWRPRNFVTFERKLGYYIFCVNMFDTQVMGLCSFCESFKELPESYNLLETPSWVLFCQLLCPAKKMSTWM